jgi:tetratricopeptide (TPR) repeat protein
MRMRNLSLLVAVLVFGAVAGALARGRSVDPNLYRGKSKREAAAALLDLSRTQAGKGSWENLAVARAYYLGGMKSEGQGIIESITSKKAVGSDWMRIGEIYYEAGEWQKAKEAFDRAMNMEPKNASYYSEAGAFYNLKGDRAKAEELFDRAFQLQSDEVWRTTDIAGSYLGVQPHRQ